MQFNFTKNRGFSIIEGMVTFAATAIILAYTLPSAFEEEIRDNVNISLEFAAPAKQALQNSCKINSNAMISNNLDAGYFYIPSGSRLDHMNKIQLDADCATDSMVIVIWTSNTGAPSDPVIELSANGAADDESWTCRIIQGEPRYVPSECRQGYKTS